MTLLYTQGFEGYDVAGGRAALEKDFNFSPVIATTEVGLREGRNGNGIAAYHQDQNAPTEGYFGYFIPTAGLSSQDDWIVGLAFYNNYSWFSTVASSRSPLIQFVDSDAHIMLSVYLAAGTLNVRAGAFSNGTKLGFANALLSTKVWHYVECKVNFHISTGSVVLHVNEEEVMNVTGVNTTTTDSLDARPSTIAVGGSGLTQKFLIDDIYICDDQGTMNNTFLGDVRIERLNPTGVGATNGSGTEFTPLAGANWDAVNDVIVDDDSTYVESSTAGDKDTYEFDVTAETPANIVAVSVKSWVRKTDAGSRNFVHVARSGTGPNTEDDSAVLYPSVTYRYMESIFETDPVSGVAWLKAEVNTAEFGYKVNA